MSKKYSPSTGMLGMLQEWNMSVKHGMGRAQALYPCTAHIDPNLMKTEFQVLERVSWTTNTNLIHQQLVLQVSHISPGKAEYVIFLPFGFSFAQRNV